MKRVFFYDTQLPRQAGKRPDGYLEELLACVIHRAWRRGKPGIVVDVHSPAWKALKGKYASLREQENAERAERLRAPREARLKKFHALWAELHDQPLKPGGVASEWLAGWLQRVPCGECRRHAGEALSSTPLQPNATPDEQWQWGVCYHNAINAMLGKPIWTPS